MVPWWLLLVGFVVGVVLALSVWAPVFQRNRCPRIKNYKLIFRWRPLGHPEETTVCVRCILDKGHDGPHHVRLNEGLTNERMDWFEDECSGSASSGA